MANLFKRPTSQFWFACYRNRHGRQIRKSTKSTDKTAALKMALEWERVENLAKDVIGQSLPSKSIEVYLQEWSEVFTRIVKRAGIDLMIVQGKGKQKFTKRTFHSLRHGFISALANSGVSEEVRMKRTGYASSDMHKKYTHLSTEPLKQDIDGLNGNCSVWLWRGTV